MLLRSSSSRLKRRTANRVADAGVIVPFAEMVVAMLGQSNMVNLSQAVVNYPLADQQARRWTGAWTYCGNVDLTNTYPPGTPSSTYGGTRTNVSPNGDGLVYFVNRLRSTIGAPVKTFEYAASGSNISQWQPVTGSLYEAFKAAQIASGAYCNAAIYLQGESNAGTSSASYQASLLAILNGLRAETTKSPFKFGVVCLGPGTTAWSTEGTLGVIRSAQLDFIAAQSENGAYFAASAHDANLAGNSIHFDAPSQARMGKRYAKGLLHQFGYLPYGAEGPKITSATLSDAAVTVHITQNGGTALADGAGGSGSALLGFRVYDGGSLCTINATAISGNTVVLTLSATPAGSVTMDYAMANAPYGSTTAPASVVYDNDLVPGDTLGLPLQPHALMAVS